jgi:glutaredoxin
MNFVVYTGKTKSGRACAFCSKAKKLLFSKGYTFVERDILADDSFARMGFTTIPQIFVEEGKVKEHIGGYTELVEYLKGDANE